MSTVSKVIITTIIVVVIILGGWWLIATLSHDSNESTGQANGQNGSSEHATDQEIAATITYNGDEFAPSSTTVKVGDTIQIVNNSGSVLFFASDEHPTHQDNSDLNVGDIEPGDSATFTIATAGTWGYHDHYNASAGGEIIVE